ncbi:iron uptake transporter deferrochelatase/peroxidase subunit [Alicyclobacillus sp.]|uniref:iron uptake transporter deferrochelatase/peroxidase subunit n=1 Tax=Alicyclobacillus sp. TaxID=61169 RepID=UPI0025C3716D|nr:iron uptake transporter deferrochelatase/peroxidase subunit [Alicyclobacillus sp.]MCL6517238.1 deferrochelatase/peroxidase EfeB [Alicyclobacillus sp.]
MSNPTPPTGTNPPGWWNRRLTRREMLRTSATGALGLVVGAAVSRALWHPSPPAPAPVMGAGAALDRVPFYGDNQAGIATPQQAHLVLAALDVTTERVSDLRDLLRTWTDQAARMTQGLQLTDDASLAALPPQDTGEAVGLPASRLTVTFGFGPSLFELHGTDRFGLASKRPKALTDIPSMPRDALDPMWCGGDLVVQACADDAQVAFHAVRNLVRTAAGVAAIRWLQRGFLGMPQVPGTMSGGGQRTAAGGASDSTSGQTPRNLFGFKDGTANRAVLTEAGLRQHVWVGPNDAPAWMRGGTYLAIRQIRMHLEVWDRTSLTEQERTFGRHKASGAPFGRQDEFDPVDPAKLPPDSHVRLARGDGSVQILRRGYSYIGGLDPKTGLYDAGLCFLSFQRDPERQFIPLLRRLQEGDLLNEYTTHFGSALFAIPPGTRPGGFIGDTLLFGL